MATRHISFMELVKQMRFPELCRILQPLKGKKCWKAEFTYGGELCLHFGGRIPHDNPRMAGETKGTWIFGTCGTPWHLVTSEGPVSSENHSEECLEPQVKGLEGATVTKVEPNLPNGTLIIFFTNGRRLLVMPSARDRRYAMPYWELFLPKHMLLAFGPGNAWTCKRSDLTPHRQASTSRKIASSAVVAKRSRASAS